MDYMYGPGRNHLFVLQEVNGIWFYNQADCEAVANLFGRWMQMGCFTAHKSLPTQKVHAYFNFRPSSVYLSVNYLDRFLSVYEIPEGNAWMIQLLSIACLFLASKMEETLVPLLLDLQMQAVTPFSFMDYFLHKFSDGNGPKKFLILQSADLILTMIRAPDIENFNVILVEKTNAAISTKVADMENFNVTLEEKTKAVTNISESNEYIYGDNSERGPLDEAPRCTYLINILVTPVLNEFDEAQRLQARGKDEDNL
ncbi:uncharacterized protein LOC144565575 [Carex rostrata]